MKEFLTLVSIVVGFGWAAASVSAQSDRPNVLFISLDDMNDWLGCYGGHPDVKTPHIDRLAERGVLFTNAHCVSPICGPSRASVLTGMRPETTGVYHNKGTYIDYVPDAVTFPEHFRANGYRVLATGKVDHGLGEPNPRLWDENGPGCGVLGTPFIDDELDTVGMNPVRVIDRGALKITLPANGGLSAIDRPSNTWDSFDWAPLDVPEDDFPDGKIANWGAEQAGKDHGAPFLLAVGFYKPHQPFFAPRKYFEMYDPKKIALPSTIAGDLHDVPSPGRDLATHPWTSGTHKTVMEHGAWRDAVRAYLATVSFVDALVGRVVDALERGPNADNTWIVLWSDHGWSLGEKEHWGKHVPWKESVRMPLMIIPPRNAAPSGFVAGTRCEAPVSLLDLYPTLVEGCGLPVRKELEGQSLLPLVSDPGADWNDAVVTTVGRGTHSVFGGDWRYVRYFDGSEELYDLREDPREYFNVAGEADLADIKQRLLKHIPVDDRHKQYVRWGRWKCVFTGGGGAMLFDYDAPFGISEQTNLVNERRDIVDAIRDYVSLNGITERHVEMPGEPGELTWDTGPLLPDPLGFGGPVVGVHEDVLIVAGGANFPNGPPWEVEGKPAGNKVWHDRVFSLESREEPWSVNAAVLPRPLAYAATVSTEDGVYVLGGEAFEGGVNRPVADVLLLRWEKSFAEVEVVPDALPPLPEPSHYHAAAVIGDVIYVMASHAATADSARLDTKSFWSLDLSVGESERVWREREPWPGPAREKMAVAVQRRDASATSPECLYLISGATWVKGVDGEPDLSKFEFYTDAHRFDPTTGTWEALAELPAVTDARDTEGRFHGIRRAASASAALGVGSSQILVFGGATGRYLTRPIEERPLFPSDVLAYDTGTNTWRRVSGVMPRGVVTTSAVKWDGRIVIPSGEIRPGVRTPGVQFCEYGD